MKKRNFWSRIKGIRGKLITGFMIPVILIIILGVISYMKASSAVIKSYENATKNSINMAGDYLDFGMNMIESQAKQIRSDGQLLKYYNGNFQNNKNEEYTEYRKLSNGIITMTSTNEFVNSAVIFASYGEGISSLGSLNAKDYEAFLQTEEGKWISESSDDFYWTGSHKFIDEKFSDNAGKYSLSCVYRFMNSKGIIFVDIKADEIQQILNGLMSGKGSIVGLIAPNGDEVIVGDNKAEIFGSQKFYQESIKAESTERPSYVDYNGEKYLYSYKKISDTGVVLCSLIPYRFILAKANEIRMVTVSVVAIAVIIAILIGTFFAAGFGNAIQKIIKVLEKAAAGDLTAKVNMKRTDEFGTLSDSVSSMIWSMKGLIEKATDVGACVEIASTKVSESSKVLVEATREITLAVEEIENGAASQSKDMENSLNQMSMLSGKINEVYEHSGEIEKITNDTKLIINKGIIIMDTLNEKSKATSEVTATIIKGVDVLNEQSQTISGIVNTINEIADQTSLLSLNASIEAARAGESGRGFAVVADEIRKLAEQSMRAASEIQNNIGAIQDQTKNTVVTVNHAEEIVSSQEEALRSSVEVFQEINRCVGELAERLARITNGVNKMEEAKGEMLNNLENMSAISQQSAASAVQVSSTISNQQMTVEELDNEVLELKKDAEKLNLAISIFII